MSKCLSLFYEIATDQRYKPKIKGTNVENYIIFSLFYSDNIDYV